MMPSRRCGARNWRGCGNVGSVDGVGVVAELEEECAGGSGVGDGECAPGVAVRYVRGIIKRGRGRDGLDEIEAGAGQSARDGEVSGALQGGEQWEAHECAERKPVAGGIVIGGRVGGGLLVGVLFGREDRPEVQGAKGAGTKGPERVKRGDHRVGVL
jgi:hypothetical protein